MNRFGSIDGVLVDRKEFATPRRDLEVDTPGSSGSVLFSSYKKVQESPVSRHSPETGRKMFKFSLDIGADGKAMIVTGGALSVGKQKEEENKKNEAQEQQKKEPAEDDSNTKTRVLNILRQMRNHNKKKAKNNNYGAASTMTTPRKVTKTVSTPRKLALTATKDMTDARGAATGSKLPMLLVTASPSPSTPKPAPILPNDCNITAGYNLIDQTLLSRPGSKFASPMVNFSPKSRLVPRMSISSEKRMKPLSPRAFAETTNIANNTNHNNLDTFLMGNELDSNWTELYFNPSRRNSVQLSTTAGATASSPNWWKYDNNITLSPLRNLDNAQNGNTQNNTNNNSIISSPVFVRHDDATDENQIMRINQHSKEIYRQHNQSLLQKLTTPHQQHASHPTDPVNTISMSHIYRSLHNGVQKEQHSAGIAVNDNVEDDAGSALKTLIK